MLQILLVTLPFFALVLCGFAATWRGALPLSAIPGLNGYVLFFALPAMLFQFGARTPLAQLLDVPVFASYTAVALVMVALAVLVSRKPWRAGPPAMGWNDSAFGALVAAFPNTGFMGVPLLVALLGQAAAGPMIVMIAVDMVLTSSLCIALSRLDSEGGWRIALRQALRGMAGNPMPWAIALGVLFSALQWQWPGPVARTLDMLAQSASPVALFTIGAVLARSQRLMREDHSHRIAWSEVLPVTLLKLFVHPLMMALALKAMALLGAGVPPTTATVLIVAAALPSASNVSLLAERMGANNGRIARIILVTTAAAFFTFALILSALQR
ncbi:AEC family transporter [Amphibiibacter pelophylacis]|uniref:AEC family transporter n=1 Tax=Amphibiibacter pelophylacis TaxID=1799477 RepID=A0ACC6NZ10_9BURK